MSLVTHVITAIHVRPPLPQTFTQDMVPTQFSNILHSPLLQQKHILPLFLFYLQAHYHSNCRVVRRLQRTVVPPITTRFIWCCCYNPTTTQGANNQLQVFFKRPTPLLHLVILRCFQPRHPSCAIYQYTNSSLLSGPPVPLQRRQYPTYQRSHFQRSSLHL